MTLDLFKRSPAEYVEEYQKTSGQNPGSLLYRCLIAEEYEEFYSETIKTEDNKANQLKELADLVYVCYGLANSEGWDLDEALYRIHQNNMGRMVQPDGSILRREDGKIIKNKDYAKVNLEDLV